ncbi:hypothetical protein BCR43DRAFT_513957 [Syncephalastrum racemosum]|uniref:Uncharacterized protein n=1 Tax=Syncephalastrum racemosum TaxID=13706 RepID=A0A1X2HF75_SYNRA|nr:hypothetical protein BCR43DRAFT_513957 [Syncephalastrum racemosum]
MLRSTTRTCTRTILQSQTCRNAHRPFGTFAHKWFKRFLTPKEEKELLDGLTSTFRNQLAEQSAKSTQRYSDIIEQVIFSGNVGSPSTASNHLSLDQLKSIQGAINDATNAKDVARLTQLENTIVKDQVTHVPTLNRLIRGYVHNGAVDKAEGVLQHLIHERRLMPSTRTYTYLIQAHLQQGHPERAGEYVDMMHKLLLKPRSGFDCGVLLQFYHSRDKPLAADALWRHINQHLKNHALGYAFYTRYMDWLMQQQDKEVILEQVARHLLAHPTPTAHGVKSPYQSTVFQNAARILVKRDVRVAEALFWRSIQPNNKTPISRDALEAIFEEYFRQDKDLRVLALYYHLRQKEGSLSDDAFSPSLMNRIQQALRRVEKESDKNEEETREALLNAFAQTLPE